MTQQHPITPSWRELFDLLMQSGGDNRAFSNEWLEPFAQAILARWGLPAAEPEGPTDEEMRRRFLTWWREEASAMRPHPDHDHEEHARRISEIAWANGAYVARWGSQPSTVAQSGARWYDSTAPTGEP